MYPAYRGIVIWFLIWISVIVSGQDFSTEQTVQVSAEVHEEPASISLKWVNDQTGSSYKIFRRPAYSQVSWGNPLTTLEGNASEFTDNSIKQGELYEYRLIKEGEFTGYGYIVSGIRTELSFNKGKLILVLENSYIDDPEFNRLVGLTIDDLEMDGWEVSRIDVNREDNVKDVKEKIKSLYHQYPAETNALYLIGHVPVPYSGLLNPDSHASHLGAWPADVYYGTFTGNWTDNQVNYTSSETDERIWNVPGDGKFDQTTLPGDVVLQIGRIDFADLYTVEKTEKQMLMAYMEKAHSYKMGEVKAENRALIDDNFTGRTEGFASSGYRNFAPFFGAENIHPEVDFVQGTKYNGGESYMWAYGCGGGSYNNSSGVASVQDFTENDLQIVFAMMFGSYYGDWDSDNNLMRAALTQGQTLSVSWAGRPHWHYYHMAMGKNIGYAAKLTQNNAGDYFPSLRTRYSRMIHIALLGDPSLRMNYIAPPSEPVLNEEESGIRLTWNAAPGNTEGYNIYRKEPASAGFDKINSLPISSTLYVDLEPEVKGRYEYVITATSLEKTSSGTYFNESLGVREFIDYEGQTTGNDTVNYSLLKSLRISAQPVHGPTGIKLKWKDERKEGSYRILRRISGVDKGWEREIATMNYPDNEFTDLDVEPGYNYEYQIIGEGNDSVFAYVVAGIDGKLSPSRGRLIMVVENSFAGDSDFRQALDQTVTDIQMDGWTVEILEVNRNDEVTKVKQKIENLYLQDPDLTNALYLVGHVPVPYSGKINPDGRGNHLGAWPADVYYATFNQRWTDDSVYFQSSTVPQRNWNFPGDGKFDQSYIHSEVQLQTGRVDFADQFLFNESEKELLVNYLNKVHDYKSGQTVSPSGAIIDDNLKHIREGFAAGAYNNFSVMVGPENINDSIDFMRPGNSYLLGCGIGTGNYQSCDGVATTGEMASGETGSAFNLFYGPYFGDWDTQNNFLRASLAKGKGLVAIWSGRPSWQLHPLAFGANIGYCAQITQNNQGDYYSGSDKRYNRMVHVTLMGDPTLRLRYYKPPVNLQAEGYKDEVRLSWNPASEPVKGYFVYRKDPVSSQYFRLNAEMITDTSFTDILPVEEGPVEYAVKNVVLDSTASGTYLNESLGSSIIYIPEINEPANYSTEITVEVHAEVSKDPAFILLKWPNDGTGNEYKVYRRDLGTGPGWNNEIATLGGSASEFRDENVVQNRIYEYRIIKNGSRQAYGYLVSGIEVLHEPDRGIMIVVLEDSYLADQEYIDAVELTISDLERDGWRVKTLETNRDDAPQTLKEKIVEVYNENPDKTRALYLIGHVPVPYSGLINPDSHPNHLGAWPADVYYATINGEWTDKTVNQQSPQVPERIWNVPGDGRFDQSYLPADVILETGRIDFTRQFLFQESEKDLLIRYMNTAHRYKTAEIVVNRKSLVDDNFSGRSEGFASSGYRNFAPLLGPQDISPSTDFLNGTKMQGGSSYLWAYGCGGGSYQSCSGVASTQDFEQNDLQIVFSMLFGSYFGDWDSDNNLMRAALAQGYTLTTSWAGRPHWHYYHMAMGMNIGYSARLTQNNDGDFFPSTRDKYNRMVHIALLGDPSLRMTYPKPPGDLTISSGPGIAILNWSSQGDPDGFHIYRKTEKDNDYILLNSTLNTSGSFTDNTLTESGKVEYMVRSVRLETTASGSWYNESLGTGLTADITVGKDKFSEKSMRLYPNPSDGFYNILFPSLLEGETEIKIYDSTGRLLREISLQGPLTGYDLDIKDFPGGTYILYLQNEELQVRRKIVKF